MIQIVLASHGDLAKGMKMSTEMIIGHQEKLKAVSLMPNMGPEDLYEELKAAIQSEEVLFLVDVWGGTPFNQCTRLVEEHPSYRILTGMNLGMVMEACMSVANTAQELMDALIASARESIQPYPKEEKQTEVQSTVKKGYMNFVLARIDSRLLHGQVATGWTKTYNPDRIIVVSDAVSHDAVRKKMIIQASPSGVKAHVIPLSKLVELSKDDRFGNMKVLLLFENVQDALKIIEAGVNLPSLNLGSIAHKEGKVVVNTAIAMDLNDVDCLEQLIQKNIQIDVRKVPSDVAENIDTLLSKAKMLLKEEK